jgi:hypothetical protein
LADFPRLCWLALQDRVFYALVLASAAQYLVPFAAQRLLLDRLSDERRARSWNALTWACAILWTGPLSMIPFCFVTRAPSPEGTARGPRLLRGALALGIGLLWAAVLTALCVGLEYAITRALGVDLEPKRARGA